MSKHSPNRSQRSKGFKPRQVLQICVLVAVCFWLIYQVKHSHDKKNAFDEIEGNDSLETQPRRLNIGGRKDIQDPLKEKSLAMKKRDEEENEVEGKDSKNEENEEEVDSKLKGNGEDVDNKHEEGEENDDNKEEVNGDEDDSKKDEENGEEDDSKKDEENGEDDDSKHEDNGEEDDNKNEDNGEEDDNKQEENGEEDDSKNEVNEEDDDGKHEENGEEDNNKHEEEEKKDDDGNEKKENSDSRGNGDDEIDEHEQEQEKSELGIEEKEREEVNEKEENKNEDKEAQNEDTSHVDDHDHEAREEQYKGDDASSAVTHESKSGSAETERGILENHVEKSEKNGLEDGVNEKEENENKDKGAQNEDTRHVDDHDHEAREEQYKGDDASSAVTHESKSRYAETERENLENHVEKTGKNGLEDGNIAVNTEENTVDEGDSRGIRDEKSEIVNVTVKQEEKYEIVSSIQDENPILSSNRTREANNQEEFGNNLEKESRETNDTPTTSSTEAEQVVKPSEEQMSTKNTSTNDTQSDSVSINIQNIETEQRESLNSSIASSTDLSEKQKTNEDIEKKNENLESEKEKGQSETGKEDLEYHDLIDGFDSLIPLEKDVRIDLDTLPDMTTEGSKNEEVAAE